MQTNTIQTLTLSWVWTVVCSGWNNRILGFLIDRRRLPKDYDHDLNNTQEIRLVILPVTQVWKVDFAIRINMPSLFDHHVCSWFDVTNGRRIRIIIGNINGNRDVVRVSLIIDWNGSCQSNQLLFHSIWKVIQFMGRVQVTIIVYGCTDGLL